MTQSVPLTPNPDNTSGGNSLPLILDTLPDVSPLPTRGILRVQQQLDLLLLAIEALRLGASEEMLAVCQSLGLQGIIHNRVDLWRLRSTNPWRKCYNRANLTPDQIKTLIVLINFCAKRLLVPLTQLLLAAQQMKDKDIPLENNFRLSEYFSRFRSHFASRMNPRRAKVSVYLASSEELNSLAFSLLEELLFFSGTRGIERLLIRLFDGEVD
ncbi:hypothetical protein Cyast_0950 [Cyanobacterium stanieri PCC 7202]|uniref:DUF3038 domain-containing protein n=1 Tax=Cyanobacterium stanieri (strain ATCC 29140 / PCC 7202) TaxID=292563 RepID=K9YKC5_CYASC|nr:hypothetical protein Cyast_0950 [Cyanobacterium stanieri PCC 7202]